MCDLKDVEIRNFFRIFRGNKGSLGVFRGALGFRNFFVASLYTQNCILAIKLLAISKMNEPGFLLLGVPRCSVGSCLCC